MGTLVRLGVIRWAVADRFVFVEHEHLVPFDGRFRIRRAPTSPPKAQRSDERNGSALDRAIAALRSH